MKEILIPHWSSLGAIGRSPVSKLSILMPFLGYLILSQDKIIGLIAQIASPQTMLEPKPNIGFYLLYFGLFIFGMASFLFHIACPVIIKRFHSSDEYAERIQMLVNASDLKNKLVAIMRHAGIESDIGNEASVYHGTISAGLNSQPQSSVINFTLCAYYEVMDRSNTILRITIFALFSLGLILVIIPSIIALMRIFRDFVKYYI